MRSALLPALVLAACESDAVLPGLGRAEPALVASKLAVLAVGVATAPQGRGVFDNALPCARRGVITYRNTNQGRSAEFHGCDAGDGVVFDGTAEVLWVQGVDRLRVSVIDVISNLDVTVNGASAGTIEELRVTGIAFRSATLDTIPLAEQLVPDAVRVTAFGTTAPLAPGVTVQSVLFPILGPEATPNPTGALVSITEPDVRRITDFAMMKLAGILLNETLEVSRGPHSHTMSCGTTQVAIDATRNLPRLTMTWDACDLGYSTFASGTFVVEWVELAESPLRMSMLVTGALTLGGGVPTTTFSRVEWNVTGATLLPSAILVAGRLVRSADARTFSHSYLVDD